MKIINNSSNVTVLVQGIPSTFNSNVVQTVITEPIPPAPPTTICFFFDFDCGCYFNPCCNDFSDCCNRKCNPFFKNNCISKRCNCCCNRKKRFCKRRF